MQSAETVLGVLRERGRRGLPCDELYRQLFNPDLYLLAYGRIYANKGAMTPGVSGETADGMSQAKIGRIIGVIRRERYRFSPARRTYIPKKNGKRRPLGLPTWSDKLVGEVVRLLLEAYWEPRFSGRSHGFRPARGCHTALREVQTAWTGTTWFIEADIADCFGSLDHEVLLAILAEHIHDQRFLRLVRGMLQAGYLEDWVWHATASGAPQGGVVSPILSNIYLDRLDTFVETQLIPAHTRGRHRVKNPAYNRVTGAARWARQRGDHLAAHRLRQQQRGMPSLDPDDPGYRRLRYIRYADDHLLGFIGPKAEAEEIKQHLARFLRDELKLELSQDKTLITHGRSQAARFLGYDVHTRHSSTRTAVNGGIGLRVPRDVIKAKAVPFRRGGRPARRTDWIHHSDYTIVATYGSIYRGIAQYYLLADNAYRLNRLEWELRTSMLHTLAAKHRTTVTTTARKHKATIDTSAGPRTCFEAQVQRPGRQPLIARFGGLTLRRDKTAILTDRQPSGVVHPPRELITRLLKGTCELCEDTHDIHVHQIARLAELTGPGPHPAWEQFMTRRHRKTIIVCGSCYDTTHAGRHTFTP